MIEKYFEEELRYLYESGKEFAVAHPDRARFLNVDAVGDRDPYVERLFEGFAFLTARIREKLDDSLPELTEGLINLMWPQFLQEIPSAAIVQFRPRPGLLHDTKILPRGSEVLSGPVGTESIPCRFITTQDVRLNPVAVRAVEKSTDAHGNAVLKIRIDIDDKASWENLSLAPLRLYIHAERPSALAIREFLTNRIRSAVLSVNNGQVLVDGLSSRACTAAGFTAGESLVPGDSRCFSASALLLEYFVYPEKFLFVDLWGCDRVPLCDPSPKTLVWTFTFEGDMGADVRVGADNFRLFCSPVVNLYKADIEPVNHSGRSEEYRLTADASHPQSTAVHSVVSVTGIDRITGQRCDYEPLYTFKNIGAGGRTFSTRMGSGSDGGRLQFLVIGGEALDGQELRQQNLSIEAWCTNGVLAREEVGEGGINRGGRDFPDSVMVANITRPTLPCFPPDNAEYLWIFLSHQGSNYLTMASAEALKSFLRLYNWSPDPGNGRRIESITDVSAKPAQSMAGAGIIRGVRFEVSVTAAHFASVADVRMFGDVVREFLSQYVSINSFLELALVLKPSGQTLIFEPQDGRQWLI
jgi:type VI secretion system protein ImpG